MEALDIEEWVDAGAPTPMAMWQQLRRQAADGGAPDDARPEWMTVAEVAEQFRWSAKTVRADVRAGRLLAWRTGPGRPYRVRRSDAEAWATARRAPSSKRAKRSSAARTARPSSTFRDLARKAK